MARSMAFTLQPATTRDAGPLAALHTAVAQHLTDTYGHGPWSTGTSETGMVLAMRTSTVFVARVDGELVGTLRLTTKKPWAIDTDYFSDSKNPLYLMAMAVAPAKQRQGIGRMCLEEAQRIARNWPADAIRLDAYNAKAGAGDFYTRCGWKEAGRATYRGAALIYFELLL